MSNMIKAYAVRYEKEVKKTIDTHLRIDNELATLKIIPTKIITDMNEGFIEGIKADVVEEIPPEDEQKKASELLDNAKAEADRIIEEAKIEAEKIKNDTYLASQKKGYEDGMQQGNLTVQKQLKELDEKENKLQKLYQEQLDEIEPNMVKLMASLIEKITGILVDDHQEVILYLINNALKNIGKSSAFNIRVSEEDFEFVTDKKNELLSHIGDAVLNINEDFSLKKNQCIIEAGQYVTDCSLDVQLNNLITDLKLLGGV